jgi:hypothetical protein
MSSAPSPRPMRATAHLEPQADPSIVDRILDAANWPELKRWAEIALGPSSFELGVCYGIVENLASSVVGLLGLLKTFILAGLYVRANRAPAWWDVLGLPEYLAAKSAELVLGAQLKQAHDQCEELMREVMKAVKNPKMFLGKAKDHYLKLYTEKWTQFQSLVGQTNLTSKFEAGKIFGEVLLDVLMLVMTVAGAAEAAARLAGEVPELMKLAGNLKGVLRLKPGAAGLGGATADLDAAEAAGEAAETSPKTIIEHSPGSMTTRGSLSRLTPEEVQTGERLASQTGLQLTESPHIGAEFVDTAGKTYDAMGRPRAYQFFNQTEFLGAIDDHLLKSNNFTVIDLTGASENQVQIIQNYVDGLSKTLRDKIIFVGQ